MCSTKKFIDPFAFLFPTHSAFPFPDIYLHAAREGGREEEEEVPSFSTHCDTDETGGGKERKEQRQTHVK